MKHTDFAFPAAAGTQIEGYLQEGLTKREYFAALVLQGLINNFSGDRKTHNGYIPQYAYKELASESIEIADALLEELEK